MNDLNSYMASIAAYLIPILGPVAVLLAREEDDLAQYHARQALCLNVAVVGVSAAWAILAWVISWIPLVGPLVAASLFAFVILVYLAALILWVTGIYSVILGQARPLPLVSTLMRRLFPAQILA